MPLLVGALAVALLIVIVYLAVRAFRMTPGAPIQRRARSTEGTATIVLDVERADPDLSCSQRLVADAAARVLAAMPDIEQVVVLTRSGQQMGEASRTEALHLTTALPPFLLDPPSYADDEADGDDLEDIDDPDTAAMASRTGVARAGAGSRRPLAASLDLPLQIRRKIREPDDPLNVVRAILEAGGVQPYANDRVLIVGDQALIIVDVDPDTIVDPDDLNDAYVRFETSGASRGVVVTQGILLPSDVRRREMLAPSLLHAGPEGIQRMADAVAVGADPLRFAAAPALA